MFVAAFSVHLAMLFVFAGLIPFTGVSMIYAPGFVNIADTTSEGNRPLSYAVAEAGCTIGGMIMPLLFEYLRQEYTWRGALMISAGVFLQICPVALLMKPKQKAKTHETQCHVSRIPSCKMLDSSKMLDSPLCGVEGVEKLPVEIQKRIELLTAPLEKPSMGDPKKKKGSVYVQRRRERQLTVETEVLLSSSFILYLTYIFFHAGGTLTSVTFRVPFMIEARQISDWNATFLLTLFASCDLIGRIFTGVVMAMMPEKAKLVRTPIFFVNELLMAVGAFAFAGAQTYGQLALLGSFFGFCRGVWAGLYWTILTDNFGEELLHKTSGLIGFTAGIMIFCVPPFAGWLADSSGIYESVLLVSGALLIVSSGILAIWILQLSDMKAMKQICFGGGDEDVQSTEIHETEEFNESIDVIA